MLSERLAALAAALPIDRQRRLLSFAESLREPSQLSDPYGLWKGYDVLDEHIAEARDEAWANVPRKDV